MTYEFFYDASTATYGPTTPTRPDGDAQRRRPCAQLGASAALTAGSYSYIGVLQRRQQLHRLHRCVEPLTISQGTVSVSTTIFDSTGGPVTGALGEQVYDTATVTGTLAFTPTGTVTYEFFYNASTATWVRADGPDGDAQRRRVGAQFGDVGVADGRELFVHWCITAATATTTASPGAVEPLTIDKGSSSVEHDDL